MPCTPNVLPRPECPRPLHGRVALTLSQQFGRLPGVVHQITKVPSDSGYFTLVRLPDSLITQSGYLIPYREGMIAEGRIITQERRLLERFFGQLAMLIER